MLRRRQQQQRRPGRERGAMLGGSRLGGSRLRRAWVGRAWFGPCRTLGCARPARVAPSCMQRSCNTGLAGQRCCVSSRTAVTAKLRAPQVLGARMAPNVCGFNSEADPSVSLSPIHCRGLCEVWPSAGLPGGDAAGIERLAGAAGVAPRRACGPTPSQGRDAKSSPGRGAKPSPRRGAQSSPRRGAKPSRARGVEPSRAPGVTPPGALPVAPGRATRA